MRASTHLTRPDVAQVDLEQGVKDSPVLGSQVPCWLQVQGTQLA